MGSINYFDGIKKWMVRCQRLRWKHMLLKSCTSWLGIIINLKLNYKYLPADSCSLAFELLVGKWFQHTRYMNQFREFRQKQRIESPKLSLFKGWKEAYLLNSLTWPIIKVCNQLWPLLHWLFLLPKVTFPYSETVSSHASCTNLHSDSNICIWPNSPWAVSMHTDDNSEEF